MSILLGSAMGTGSVGDAQSTARRRNRLRATRKLNFQRHNGYEGGVEAQGDGGSE